MDGSFRLTGLIAAPHTPMLADGSVNPDAVAGQAELLVEQGVSGAFVCGTTGEGHSMSTEERMAIAEAWAEASRGRLKLIVHVGHNSRAEAAALAAHARRIEADAVAAVAPNYFKPGTVGDLIEFYLPVAESAGDLPFYYYDIPSLTGVTINPAELLEKGVQRIPTLRGIKFTSLDLMALQECLALGGGQFDVVFGCDENLLAALAFGCRGAVGSTYNYAAPLYRKIMEAFQRGDLPTARALQLESVRLVRVLIRFGVLRAGKAIVGMQGVPCGPVRPPLAALSDAQTMDLYEALRLFDCFARPLALA